MTTKNSNLLQYCDIIIHENNRPVQLDRAVIINYNTVEVKQMYDLHDELKQMRLEFNLTQKVYLSKEEAKQYKELLKEKKSCLTACSTTKRGFSGLSTPICPKMKFLSFFSTPKSHICVQ